MQNCKTLLTSIALIFLCQSLITSDIYSGTTPQSPISDREATARGGGLIGILIGVPSTIIITARLLRKMLIPEEYKWTIMPISFNVSWFIGRHIGGKIYDRDKIIKQKQIMSEIKT